MKKLAEPILEISSLSKKGGKASFEKVSLIIPRGKSLGVLYSNNSNAELFFEVLKGSTKCDSGKIFFKGDDVTGEKNNFGIICDKNKNIKKRTVLDSACTPLVKRGLSKKMSSVLVTKEAALFGLDDSLSTTMTQLDEKLLSRAELFTAYMCSHELIAIHDSSENTNCDIDFIEKIKSENGASLLIFTKNIDFAIRCTDSVMVVDDSLKSKGIISVDSSKLEKTRSKIEELYNS